MTKPLLFLFMTTASLFLSGTCQNLESAIVANEKVLLNKEGEKPRYRQTEQGPVVEWSSDIKLKYEDFKANGKGSPGFAVATTTSAFGYSITNDGGNISGSIFVLFYCNESWWDPDFVLDDVLEHEQLHFDICELFGRKLFKGVQVLLDENKLNKRSIERLQLKLEKQYDEYQDLYDKQTDHSINVKEQARWNRKIAWELYELSGYSNYHNF